MPDLAQYRNPYHDSSVFIAWIKGEYRDGHDCKKIAEHNFRLAKEGVFRIYTSAVTLAEVHKIRGAPDNLTDDQDERILQFFEHEYISIVDVDREVGEQANRFCRQYGLRPMDAIHLACALKAGCDVLLAWDDDYSHVKRPDIRCEYPEMLGQLELSQGGENA